MNTETTYPIKTDMLDEMKQEIAKKGGMKEWVKSI